MVNHKIKPFPYIKSYSTITTVSITFIAMINHFELYNNRYMKMFTMRKYLMNVFYACSTLILMKNMIFF